jgi:hypothetical protein
LNKNCSYTKKLDWLIKGSEFKTKRSNRRFKNLSLKATDCVGRYNRNIESDESVSKDRSIKPKSPTANTDFDLMMGEMMEQE